MSDPKDCFVIAPIGEQDSDTRKRSDQVLKFIIRPAVESCGYQAIRADEIDKPGIITSQVIQRVVNDPLVVADLTDRNPNVFYELAIRHAIRKPFVQIIQKGERIPFDVAGTRTIQVDHKDLESVDSAKQEIAKQVRSLENDSSDLETPISVSLELQLLRQSDDPEERSLAEVVGMLSEMRSGLAKIESRLGSSEEGSLESIEEALRSMPMRLDKYFDRSSSIQRKSRRFHPGMIEELVGSMSRRRQDPIGILVISSMLRDEFPWLYELGMEIYRRAKAGNVQAAAEALEDFRLAAEYSLHGPFAQDVPRTKEHYYFLEELSFLLERYTRSLEIPGARPGRPARKRAADDSGK